MLLVLGPLDGLMAGGGAHSALLRPAKNSPSLCSRKPRLRRVQLRRTTSTTPREPQWLVSREQLPLLVACLLGLSALSAERPERPEPEPWALNGCSCALWSAVYCGLWHAPSSIIKDQRPKTKVPHPWSLVLIPADLVPHPWF